VEKSPAAKLRAIALIACAAAAAPCPAAPLRLSASLGFGGTVVPGRWNPLWARCDGDPGAAEIEVVLRSEDGTAIGTESFPCRDGLRVECPVMVDERLGSVSVRLASSGEILAEEKLPARSRLFPGHVVLVCGELFDDELAISRALYPAEPVQAVSASLADLPSRGLDYDAVSAIALRDPGRALTPAQRDAMAAWIAGGGRLAVTEPRKAGDSLVGMLAEDGAAPPSVLILGLGSIALVGEAPAAAGPAAAERRWRAALALSPYGQKERLTASRVFKSGADSFSKGPESSRAELALLVALALWAGVAIFAARNRRKSLVPVVAAAAASLAFALAGAAGLDSMLMRWASVSERALVLPGEGFALASIGVRASFGDARRDFLGVAAVRGLEIEYGRLERGLMESSDRAPFAWKHALSRTALSLRSSSRDSLDLAGVLEPEALVDPLFPAGAPRDAFPNGGSGLGPDARLAVSGAIPGDPSWLVLHEGRWIAEGSPPSWLGPDAAWIASLRALAPDLPFLVGRSRSPAPGMRVGGSASRDLLWAMPVVAAPGEARP
jgi:hypothetical protein